MAIEVEHVGDSVVLRLGPVGTLLAIKGRLDVPRDHVTSVEVMDRGEVPATPGAWLRAPGTRIPGLLRFGSYGQEPQREFWAVFGRSRVVVVHVRDWAYHRLVLGSSDPDALAAAIRG